MNTNESEEPQYFFKEAFDRTISTCTQFGQENRIASNLAYQRMNFKTGQCKLDNDKKKMLKVENILL